MAWFAQAAACGWARRAASCAVHANTTASKAWPSTVQPPACAVNVLARVPHCSWAPAAASHRAAGSGSSADSGARGNSRSAEPGPLNKRIAHDAQEDLRAGLGGGRIQRRHAQGFDQAVAHTRRQPPRQRGDAGLRIGRKATEPPAQRGCKQTQALADRPAAPAEHRAHECGHGRAAGQAQARAVRGDQCQRHAQQQLLRVRPDAAHQRQRGAVGADQDVLAIVQCDAVAVIDAAGAAPELRRHFDQGHVMPRRCGGHGCGDAGPAAADHGHAAPGGGQRSRQCVCIAIQTLRSGVNVTRWCRTWKSSAAISRSSVR